MFIPVAFIPLGMVLAVLVFAFWRTHRLNRRLTAELRRLKAGRSFAAYGTWDWAVGQDELHWSDEVFPMFGLIPGQVQPSYSLFCSLLHPDDVERVRAAEIRCVEGQGTLDLEYRVIHPDGGMRWLRETGNVLEGPNGKPGRMIGMVRDITEEKTREERILHQAFHDDLTGLPNRTYFRALLDDALARARRDQEHLALAFIDLNRFKPINDSLGHAVGDKVLVALAERLKQGLRSSDHVARLGGDEFVAVIEGIQGPADAQNVVGKLHDLIHHPIKVADHSLHVGASIGVSLYPYHGENGDDLVRKADEAMYEAKKSGDIIRFFTP